MIKNNANKNLRQTNKKVQLPIVLPLGLRQVIGPSFLNFLLQASKSDFCRERKKKTLMCNSIHF